MTPPVEAALDARTEALLDERARALAARPAGAARAMPTEAFLVCACGAERYGLPLASVAGVTPERPCTPLPGAPAALRGICAMAGSVVSVLDLAACLGPATASGADAGTGHLVRLRAQEVAVALAVDRVIGIARIEAAPAEAAETLGDGPLLGYVPPASDRTGDVRDGFSILDLPALLARFLT